MSSESKTASNRETPSRSTGPITEAGKQTVAGNAVTHGLAGSSKQLAKLARSKGSSFQPADHFPPTGDFGGFVYSDHDLAQVITRTDLLEEARARFAPAPPPRDLTMRDIEALIG